MIPTQIVNKYYKHYILGIQYKCFINFMATTTTANVHRDLKYKDGNNY